MFISPRMSVGSPLWFPAAAFLDPGGVGPAPHPARSVRYRVNPPKLRAVQRCGKPQSPETAPAEAVANVSRTQSGPGEGSK